jgi:hypothetical protein
MGRLLHGPISGLVVSKASRARGVDDLEHEWRGALKAHEHWVSRTVEVAYPDEQDEGVENADGPGVAKAD